MKHKYFIVGILLVFILTLSIRMIGLGSFMTADEENWMIRSGEFWHNLFLNNDPGGTFRTSHPGVITMWVSGAGIFLQELRLGYHIDQSNLSDFRLAATAPIAIVVSILIAYIVWQLRHLIGPRAALFSGILLALDPYSVGMSQISHLDMLLALFMLTAFTSFLRYVAYSKENVGSLGSSRTATRQLIVVGIFTGLALLNKLLPALWLFPMYALVALVSYRGLIGERLREIIRTGMFVFGVASLTFFLLWPALLVMQNTTEYFQRDTVTIVTDEHISSAETEEPIEPVSFYVRTVLGRLPLFTLVLVVAGMAAMVLHIVRFKTVPPAFWFLVFALGFLIFITVPAKKADRYAMPALTMFTVAAAWASVVGFEVLRKKQVRLLSRIAPLAVGAVIVLLLVIQALVWSPYAIAYNNPLFTIRPFPQQGWGEGLDAAARYINNHPFIDRLYIASWYPGITGTYSNAKTLSLSSRDDHRVGYVITYRNMEGRAEDDIASNVLDEFSDKEPEHIIYIGGEPYAWIYNTMGPWYFRQHVGEITGGIEAGQIVPVYNNTWSAIDIAFATFSGRNNTEDVMLTIKENPDAEKALRTVAVNARNIEDEAWHTFAFDPIENTSGKTFYVSITSPNSSAGNAVTVRYSQDDILPGQLLLRREARKGDTKNSDFLKPGDMAYRISR